MVQLSLDSLVPTRRPICVVCGKLGTHWFQPLIGTENFCGRGCVFTYVGHHRFSGQAEAIHTDNCHHYSPTDQPS